MTRKEMTRLKVAERLINGDMRLKEASRILNISTRQVIRIKERVSRVGPEAVIHGNRVRKPVNATAGNIKDLVVALKKDKYKETNFSHFTELIAGDEGIHLSRPTVHRILAEAGILSPRKKRKKARSYHYRERMDCPGAMVQLDASPYEWLGGTKLALHGAIDDATGKVLGLYITKEECLLGYFEVVRQMIRSHGIPVSTYNDRHAIFVSPKAKLTIEDELQGKRKPYTHFSKAMDELGVTMIPAGSPQAKGRIERLWATLQDRLVNEFSLKGIKDTGSANLFVRDYMDRFNQRFGISPKGESVFRKFDKRKNIDHILCLKTQRKLDNGSAFSFGGSYYQLIKNGKPAATIPRSTVKVMTGRRIGIKAEYSGKVYSLEKIEKQKAKVIEPRTKKRAYKRPAKDHPWRSKGYDNPIYDKREKKISLGLYDSRIAWETDSF